MSDTQQETNPSSNQEQVPGWLAGPRRPAEEWLYMGARAVSTICDAADRHEADGRVDVADHITEQAMSLTVQLGQAEALVRIADHLEELLDELREHRPAALSAVLDTTAESLTYARSCASCGRDPR